MLAFVEEWDLTITILWCVKKAPFPSVFIVGDYRKECD
jgi:hypothetical protein